MHPLALPLIGLALLLFLVALGRDIAPGVAGDARIWQAVIAGAVVAGGWLANAEIDRRKDDRRRERRRRDVTLALRAEIAAIRWQLVGDLDAEAGAKALAARRDDFVQRIRGDNIVPFIPTEHNDMVYLSILPDIHLLDERQIASVVQFYDSVKNSQDLASDMRSDNYAALESDRRALICSNFFDIKVTTLKLGESALAALDGVK